MNARWVVPLALVGLGGSASAQPVLNPETGHYYELVLATDIDWFAARHGAAELSFHGLPGYLVTITSAGENDFLYATFATDSADALAWTGGWEPSDDGVWRWAVGPEAGTQYSSGSSPDPAQSYVNWVGSEPNDFAVDEDFMSYLIGGFSGFEGGWADSPEVPTGSDPTTGYLVEYETQGVTPGEPTALHVANVDRATGELELSYTPGCAALDHSIVFGPLADVSIYGYSGQVCPIGASGAYSGFDPGPGSFFFLLVGNDGAGGEGSYGTNDEGTERPEDVTDPVCAAFQDLSGRCD